MRPFRYAAILLSLALASLPATVSAQFGGIGGAGGRGGMGGRGGGMGGGRAGAPGAGARRSAPLINSVELVLSHRADLALTDSQVTRLTSVKAVQDSALAVVRARLDSITPTDDPIAQRDRAQARGAVMVAYRDTLKKGRASTFAVLAKRQRKQAGKLEKALKKEMEADSPMDGERVPGGRRRPG